jgi:hypothetical protein
VTLGGDGIRYGSGLVIEVRMSRVVAIIDGLEYRRCLAFTTKRWRVV